MLSLISLAAWEASSNPMPANEVTGPDKNILIPSAILSTIRGFFQQNTAPPFWPLCCFFLRAGMVANEDCVMHRASFIVSFVSCEWQLPRLSLHYNWLHHQLIADPRLFRPLSERVWEQPRVKNPLSDLSSFFFVSISSPQHVAWKWELSISHV